MPLTETLTSIDASITLLGSTSSTVVDIASPPAAHAAENVAIFGTCDRSARMVANSHVIAADPRVLEA